MRGPLLAVLLAIASCLAAQEFPESYALDDLKLKSDFFPAPPAQHEPWTPPDSEYSLQTLESVDLAFKYGLADPRGCEYREIAVLQFGNWGGRCVLWTEGWVLPDVSPEGRRFAVCWDGIVHPVVEVGEPRDYREAAFEELANRASEETPPTPQGPVFLGESPWPLTTRTGFGWARTALLLRLGEAELALALDETRAEWKRPRLPKNPDDNAIASYQASLNIWNQEARTREQILNTDLFAGLTNGVVAATYIRALFAHEFGDDHLALRDLRMLNDLLPKLEAEYKQRGVEPRGGIQNDRPYPYFYFVTFLNPLLADQERREENRQSGHVAPDDPVMAMIERLEDVRARQSGQPGSVHFATHSLVHGLAAQGADAIGPLVECIAQDDRLTRSIQFHRDFFLHGRVIVPVREAGLASLRLLTGVHSNIKERIRDATPAERAIIVQELSGLVIEAKDLRHPPALDLLEPSRIGICISDFKATIISTIPAPETSPPK